MKPLSKTNDPKIISQLIKLAIKYDIPKNKNLLTSITASRLQIYSHDTVIYSDFRASNTWKEKIINELGKLDKSIIQEHYWPIASMFENFFKVTNGIEKDYNNIIIANFIESIKVDLLQ